MRVVSLASVWALVGLCLLGCGNERSRSSLTVAEWQAALRAQTQTAPVAPASGDATYRSIAPGTNASLGFLIEGATTNLAASGFVEVILAQTTAGQHGGGIFDAIHSYDTLHQTAFILGREGRNPALSDADRKLFAAHVIVLFSDEVPLPRIIDGIIRAPYQAMKDAGRIAEVPEWVRTLSADNVAAFLEQILTSRFESSIERFRAALADLSSRVLQVSNDVSKDSLLRYLADFPGRTRIYGLIGRAHLPFLDSAGTVVRQTATERHVRIHVGTRDVDVHLFGGTHGDLAHYRAMLAALPAQR